ncbi:hypothetical protein PROFUN_01457 [Planoprotostelium fungivorum]|uniref:Uncharacterized protein n=1 Tax=Planoprotostelium fungivorum TaxID=1890364 RepID=A0A2P6NT96_9EUKA|nr:hypothetical protein PROFUN_01457 [Planoprotostelium fungivorum]
MRSAIIVFALVHLAAAGCSGPKIGTMTGYDNTDGHDDKHPGSLMEYDHTTPAFWANVNAVSIYDRDWSQWKYHNIIINYKGKNVTVQSWDACTNADCPEDPQCCTHNAQKFAKPGFLVDVEKRVLKSAFNITNYNDVMNKITIYLCDAFDHQAVANKYHLSN